ncbi:MAG: sugar nucleotide-binding protein [Nitrospinae bacterium]|nr:sugar nucleotide-binding protein [Nitrospinota bacterium]
MKTPSPFPENKDASILIVGASGYIGRSLYEGLSPPFHVYGTYCSAPLRGGIYFDLTASDPESLPLRDVKYAVLLAAKPKIDYCKLNPEQSAKVNVEGTANLLACLRRRGVFPIFLSSDAVYPGTAGGYDESCPGPALNCYGRQKRSIEDYILENFRDYCILRISKTVGYVPGRPDLLETLCQGLVAGEELKLLEDQKFQVLSLDDLKAAIRFVVENKVVGLFNVASPETTDRIEIASHLASLMKVESVKLKKVKMEDLGFADRRAENSSMKIDKFLALAPFKFQGVREILRNFLMNRGAPIKG